LIFLIIIDIQILRYHIIFLVGVNKRSSVSNDILTNVSKQDAPTPDYDNLV